MTNQKTTPDPTPDPTRGRRRIHVVGSSGAGKTWLGERLAKAMGVPFLDLDAVHHQANWRPLPGDAFVAEVSAFVEADDWVVVGNYAAVRETIWRRADEVIWLDLPRHVVMPALAGRTLRRLVTREELWNGNKEEWRNHFSRDPDRNVMLFAWTNFDERREQYAAASSDPRRTGMSFLRLRSRREMQRLLADAG